MNKYVYIYVYIYIYVVPIFENIVQLEIIYIYTQIDYFQNIS